MSTYYVGVMSGTSMDGVDAVLVNFPDRPAPRIQVIAHHSEIYGDALKQQLIQLAHNQGTLDAFGEADHQVARHFAETINQLLQKAQVTPDAVCAIGSHGQTLRHKPQGPHPFTLQAGDPSLITELTGITTVADFRRRDMAAGGEGAPLAPGFHAWLFSSPTEYRALVNLGGIANISLLPPQSIGKTQATITGYDTGPANALMDAWIHHVLQQPFDLNGDWARQGQINQAWLNSLLEEPFFKQPAPKSTGKERFNLDWVLARLPAAAPMAAVDVQRTLLELTACTVADAIKSHQPLPSSVYLCGGGAQNSLLQERIQAVLAGCSVKTTAALGLDPQLIEACAFAWLAKQTMAGLAGNIPSVTGAKGERILGTVCRAG